MNKFFLITSILTLINLFLGCKTSEKIYGKEDTCQKWVNRARAEMELFNEDSLVLPKPTECGNFTVPPIIVDTSGGTNINQMSFSALIEVNSYSPYKAVLTITNSNHEPISSSTQYFGFYGEMGECPRDSLIRSFLIWYVPENEGPAPRDDIYYASIVFTGDFGKKIVRRKIGVATYMCSN